MHPNRAKTFDQFSIYIYIYTKITKAIIWRYDYDFFLFVVSKIWDLFSSTKSSTYYYTFTMRKIYEVKHLMYIPTLIIDQS